MRAVSARAPGKIILFGEHAVVYGQPALAVPVDDVQASAFVKASKKSHGLTVIATDVSEKYRISDNPQSPLSQMAQSVLKLADCPEPDADITIRSTIPIAAGLGSGAAVAAAVGRALADFVGYDLSEAGLSALVYEVEKLYHGYPSGIDNTVICFRKPVYFVRENPPEIFLAARPFHLLIGDTGIPSPTKDTVMVVREGWQRSPQVFEKLFSAIGEIVRLARAAIAQGDIDSLGTLMLRNQEMLRALGVSAPKLERLIDAAQSNGARGAKLSGGGGGGNMIALVDEETADNVMSALRGAGAVRIIHTVVR